MLQQRHVSFSQGKAIVTNARQQHLHCCSYVPKDPLAVVVFLPGLDESCLRYEGLFKYLAAQQIAVFALEESPLASTAAAGASESTAMYRHPNPEVNFQKQASNMSLFPAPNACGVTQYVDDVHQFALAICPGTPFRKRTHPSSSRDIDVSSTGVVRLAAALDTVPPASMRDYSAILGHILATYVDTSCSQHPRQVSPPVLRIAVHALVRHLCDVQRAGSSYLPLLQHISPALASHPAMQTLLKTQLLAHVLKRHAATYPDFVLHYIQLARRKLNALAASSSSPLHKDNNNHDLEDYINTFLDTGKVPAPIRTRLLLQDATWHGKLKPALLAARDVGSHVLSLGWMQLVHTLAREGAIRHSEYAPFVAAMHGIVQVRAASRGAECPVDQLATELVDSMAGTCTLPPTSADLGTRMVRRLQTLPHIKAKTIEFVNGGALLTATGPNWPATKPLVVNQPMQPLSFLEELCSFSSGSKLDMYMEEAEKKT
ncbi:hypothetical protein DYB30_004175 [Aphanomyces astaci]|uniref:Uncharacterized protein n=1 Tax=Aphanomyces astaci TaxID=112090 RepID=A0A397CUH0_APHAT|nr:hypothetical protein DYB30_004175 [Aphanomyces astaci]